MQFFTAKLLVYLTHKLLSTLLYNIFLATQQNDLNNKAERNTHNKRTTRETNSRLLLNEK